MHNVIFFPFLPSKSLGGGVNFDGIIHYRLDGCHNLRRARREPPKGVSLDVCLGSKNVVPLLRVDHQPRIAQCVGVSDKWVRSEGNGCSDNGVKSV